MEKYTDDKLIYNEMVSSTKIYLTRDSENSQVSIPKTLEFL